MNNDEDDAQNVRTTRVQSQRITDLVPLRLGREGGSRGGGGGGGVVISRTLSNLSSLFVFVYRITYKNYAKTW